ncbi:hypothetical protein VKS41_006852 [Umbelopsis sp. WA50703]
MKLTLLPWLLLAIGTASATYSGHDKSSKASQHKSVATHTKHIRSEPTLYHRHCKTDDDCPGVSCCNLWSNRCTFDPKGTICDIKPSTLHHSSKKSTTHKKSKTTSKKKSTTTTKHKTTATTSSKKSHPTETNQNQGQSDSNTTPTHQPDSLSAGNDGSSSTTESQPTVNDPNNPVTNQPASETNSLATVPTGASTDASNTVVVSASGSSALAAGSSSPASTSSNANGNSNSIANSNTVAGDVTNTKIGIGIGVGVGCVAAIGLAGLVLYRRREGRQQDNYDSGSGEPVSTRWRPQSFMAVLGGVVAKLPRTNSTSSRSSRLRSVFSNLSRNSSNRSYRSDGSGPSVGSAPSLARVDEHVSDGHNMRQY